MLHRDPYSKEAKTWLGKDKDSERDSTGLSVCTLGRLRFKFIEGVFSSYVIWLSKMRSPKAKFNITCNRKKKKKTLSLLVMLMKFQEFCSLLNASLVSVYRNTISWRLWLGRNMVILFVFRTMVKNEKKLISESCIDLCDLKELLWFCSFFIKLSVLCVSSLEVL